MLGYFVIDSSVEVDVVTSHSTTSSTGSCNANVPSLPDANTEVDGIHVVLIGFRAT